MSDSDEMLKKLSEQLKEVFRNRHQSLHNARNLLATIPDEILTSITDHEHFNRGSLDSASWETLHGKIEQLQNAGADKHKDVQKLINEFRTLADTKDLESRLSQKIKALLPEGKLRTHVDGLFSQAEKELHAQRVAATAQAAGKTSQAVAGTEQAAAKGGEATARVTESTKGAASVFDAFTNPQSVNEAEAARSMEAMGEAFRTADRLETVTGQAAGEAVKTGSWISKHMTGRNIAIGAGIAAAGGAVAYLATRSGTNKDSEQQSQRATR